MAKYDNLQPMKNPHAQALGSLGGKAGRGKVKARTKAQARKAAIARWAKPGAYKAVAARWATWRKNNASLKAYLDDVCKGRRPLIAESKGNE